MRGAAAPVVAILILLAGGCVFRAGQSRTAGPEALHIAGVPVFEFAEDDCGASSLYSLLAYWGLPGTLEALSAELPRVRKREVLTIDLMLAARRYGLDAHWTVGDADSLRREIVQQRPVILMLRVAKRPGPGREYYHYVIANGFDPEVELVHVLIGDGTGRWVPLRRLSRAWRGAGNALLAATPARRSGV